jgi:hypothetical protein
MMHDQNFDWDFYFFIINAFFAFAPSIIDSRGVYRFHMTLRALHFALVLILGYLLWAK